MSNPESQDQTFAQLSSSISDVIMPSMGEIPSRLTSFLGIDEVLRQQLELGRHIAQNSENSDHSNDRPLQLSIQIDGNYDEEAEPTPRPPRRVHNPGEEEEEEEAPSTDATRIELQVLMKWLENSIPFFLLLLGLFLYQHKFGIMLFLWHFSVLFHTNQALKKQVALKENRQVSLLLGIIGILLIHIAGTYLSFQSSGNLWRSLFLLPPNTNISVWDVLWYISMNDLMVRFGTMIAKCIFIILFGKLPSHKRKGQLYTVIEIFSHLYRALLPIPIWFTYFLNDENGQIFSCIIGGLYLTFKLTSLLSKVKLFFTTIKAYLIKEVPFGTYASQEEVTEVGDQCSICQEKMTSPVKLACGHIFCESCISEWFEREKTCPLCRTIIKCAGNLTHSDGSTSLLLQIF